MNFTLCDLVVAYQKAKADAWLRRDLNELDYLRYENDLFINLHELSCLLNRNESEWLFDVEWLGGWRLAAKKVDLNPLSDDDISIFSDQMDKIHKSRVKSVEYRVYALPSINFQVLSSLWIQKVGWKFDQKLGRNIYGNRLRPLRNGRPNRRTRGSFRYYVPMFSRWKRDGIDALRNALSGSEAIVVTADAKSFFHTLRPDFLLSRQFLSRNGIRLSPDERQLTKCLIKAINQWASQTPLGSGLPVGLAASGVIANAALLDFDRAMDCVENRIFYGRYVDDILLVFQKRPGIESRSAAWHHIANADPCLKELIRVSKNQNSVTQIVGVQFSPEYESLLTNSQVAFTGEKCRAFFLDKDTGPSFVETLQRQIYEVTSEFRYLPRTVMEPNDVTARIQKLLSSDGSRADNFRKIDAFVLKRNDLRAVLRELRFLMRTLDPQCWRAQREALYKVVGRFVVRPQLFVEYAEREIPQILSMAAVCGDFAELERLIKKIWSVSNRICAFDCSKISGMVQYGCSVLTQAKWRDELFLLYARAVETSLHGNPEHGYREAYCKFYKAYGDIVDHATIASPTIAFGRLGLYVLHDLAYHSCLAYCYGSEVRPYGANLDIRSVYLRGTVLVDAQCISLLGKEYCESVTSLWRYMSVVGQRQNRVPYALLFPTRPICVRDLALFGGRQYACDMDDWFVSLRGYRPTLMKASVRSRFGEPVDVIEIYNNRNANPTVALVNLETDAGLCIEALNPIKPDVVFGRLKTLVLLINQILSQPTHLDYIVLHELSIPLRWFVAFADCCKDSGISLIAGTTYRVMDSAKKVCRNEIWMSLVKTGSGAFRETLLRCEPKAKLAHEEACLLQGKGWRHDPSVGESRHAVIVHGNFAFSVLICSELTEIAARARLVGLVDAVFVLAWNRDLHSFSSLVESSAIDLHAYIVESNNNCYGDSRIRSPSSAGWLRDSVRLRGGIGVYCVIGRLDVRSLRKFQAEWNPDEYFAGGTSSGDSSKTSRPFKPLPIGYGAMPEYRTV